MPVLHHTHASMHPEEEVSVMIYYFYKTKQSLPLRGLENKSFTVTKKKNPNSTDYNLNIHEICVIILFTLFIITWLQEADKRVTALPEGLTCPLALVWTWTGVDLQLTILHLCTHTCMHEHAHKELYKVVSHKV